ncbi:acyl-CoA N-acyltransferase [Phlebopus sp. FC_14]|nr:acyl-CoA N-acyltransferase [Phlebopus sp. FC_14]
MATQTGNLQIRPIDPKDTWELRHSVLWPSMPFSYVQLEEDNSGHHFGAFFPSQDKPVAVISVFLEPIPDASRQAISARFRKFACYPEFQGRGIGSKLLDSIIAPCSELGVKVIWCDARLSSSQWYSKRGLIPFGESFFKESVEYIRMKMELVGPESG